jgi:uncharacterized protein YjaG (DUF416 family)
MHKILVSHLEEIMGIFDFMRKQSELPYPDPRLVEAARLIDVQIAAIAKLEKEIEAKDQKIASLDSLVKTTVVAFSDMEKHAQNMIDELDVKDRLLEEYKQQEDRLIKEIYRLRADLKKRTDQYNDLVDLAREKGIIGE